jgi:hypothetical protein
MLGKDGEEQPIQRCTSQPCSLLPHPTPNREHFLDQIVQVDSPILRPERIVQLVIERIGFAIDSVGGRVVFSSFNPM